MDVYPRRPLLLSDNSSIDWRKTWEGSIRHEKEIRRVAVLGGSGGSFIPEVAASGADAYVTGDLDYHDALLAESLNLTAVDAGHAATELPPTPPTT